MAGESTQDGAVAGAWRALWISRLVVFASGAIAVLAWGVRDRSAQAYDPGGLTRPFGTLGDALVAPGARWDAVWFLRIAEDGYDADRAAFFPLYPLLVKAGGVVLAGGIGAVLAWGGRDDNAQAVDPEGFSRPFGAGGDDLVAPLGRWDAGWVLRIAADS